MRFSSGYLSHPFCSPTRAALMTGRYQQRFGHQNKMKFKLNDEVAGLPLSEVTLPQVLSGAEYVTGLVGKWHQGQVPWALRQAQLEQETLVFFMSDNGGPSRNADAPAELYDVERDPGESKNLAGSRPADVNFSKILFGRWAERWRAGVTNLIARAGLLADCSSCAILFARARRLPELL